MDNNYTNADGLILVLQEMHRQDIKWGEQNHPLIHTEWAASYKEDVYNARIDCDYYAKEGRVTWGDIILEEVQEALAADTEEDQIEELIQVAAVALQAIASIKRNKQNG